MHGGLPCEYLINSRSESPPYAGPQFKIPSYSYFQTPEGKQFSPRGHGQTQPEDYHYLVLNGEGPSWNRFENPSGGYKPFFFCNPYITRTQSQAASTESLGNAGPSKSIKSTFSGIIGDFRSVPCPRLWFLTCLSIVSVLRKCKCELWSTILLHTQGESPK